MNDTARVFGGTNTNTSAGMRPRDIAAAVLVACLWGLAFVATKVGLRVFTPTQLTFLRFTVACVAVLWLPRPQIPLRVLIGVGLTVFAGQFLLQFYGVAMGMPAGLTAVVSQTQALFTVVFAALVLHDRPTLQQAIGLGLALAGLAVIGSALGGSIPAIAFFITLASAVSWAIGNLLLKRMPKVNMLHLMVWASLVPPLPALLLSLLMDPPGAMHHAQTTASWLHWAVPVYLGLVATVFAYAIWGGLLQRYSAGAVAPFALLAPCVGAVTSAVFLGERFSAAQLAGMAAVLLGVLVTISPRARAPR